MMQLQKELPEIFEEFGEARRNGFINAREMKDILLIAVFCT